MVRRSLARNNAPPKPNSSSLVAIGFTFIIAFLLGHLHAQLTNQAIGSIDSYSIGVPQQSNGWHSIDVFYGQTDHLERMLPEGQEWFSQVRQDEAIAKILGNKRNGYFVDLAANDATFLSNTYALERKLGWNGLCIEPNPMYWSNLTYRDCQVVAAVVGEERMKEMPFLMAAEKGGAVGQEFNNKDKWKGRAVPKYTVTLLEILQRYNAPQQIDYLSLDVEGAEHFIMKNFPLDKYSISIMTVERPNDELKALLERHGFSKVTRFSNWGETLWLHKSALSLVNVEEIDQEFKPTKKPKSMAEA